MPPTRFFELGIVMAGAVSAGAYSAGVMDFLMEALNAFEDAKTRDDWDGPVHNVRIPVMTGASAGGMTAAISALHAFHGLAHVWPDAPVPAPADNRLYSSWVSDISIEALLETTDLDGGGDQHLKSALCCDVLDRILKDAFTLNGAIRTRNWIGRGEDRSLRVMLTLTNIAGVPYSFKLFGANSSDRYGMLNHGDYLDFTVGIAPNLSDQSHALDIQDTNGAGWDLFKTAALATAAFPVGLAPRIIKRSPADYQHSERVGYEDSVNGGFVGICPDKAFGAETPYRFVSVDGGTVDNEPLELARRYLSGGGDKHNPQDGKEAIKAVVLIAPFPNFREPPPSDLDDKLIHVLPLLASALIDQARFKPDELEEAANDTIFSRFMISPIRRGNGSPEAIKYPIACGALNGFSGFLHKSFRRHDYLLGRRNAQAFLRWNFALPETNDLFLEFKVRPDRWYVRNADDATSSISAAAGQGLERKRFAEKVGEKNETFGLPIIPLVDRLRDPIEIGQNDMPKPDAVSRDDLHSQIRNRAQKVIATLVDIDLRDDTKRLGFVIGNAVRLGARHYLPQIISQRATDAVDKRLDAIARAFAIPRR